MTIRDMELPHAAELKRVGKIHDRCLLLSVAAGLVVLFGSMLPLAYLAKKIFVHNGWEESVDLGLAVTVVASIALGFIVLFSVAILLPRIIMVRLHLDPDRIDANKSDDLNSLLDEQKRDAAKRGFRITHEIISSARFARVCIAGDQRRAAICIYLDTEVLRWMEFSFDEVKRIQVCIKPRELNIHVSGSREYVLGGALVAGPVGAMVGVFINEIVSSFRGPTKVFFWQSFSFELDNGEERDINFVNDSFGVGESNLDEFKEFAFSKAGEMQSYLADMRRYFGDKIQPAD